MAVRRSALSKVVGSSIFLVRKLLASGL